MCTLSIKKKIKISIIDNKKEFKRLEFRKKRIKIKEKNTLPVAVSQPMRM